MTPQSQCCLVCLDRTGSNYVQEYLNLQPGVVFYNELFHRQSIIFDMNRILSDSESIDSRDSSPSAFIDRVFSGHFEAYDKNISAIGFKLFLNHNADALGHVLDSACKLLFLSRANYLARFSSFKIAAASDAWRLEGPTTRERVRVEFMETEFRAYMENARSLEMLFERSVASSGRQVYRLSYQSFFSDPAERPALLQFLGVVPSTRALPRLIKQNSKDICGRFSNANDARRFIERIGRPEWSSE